MQNNLNLTLLGIEKPIYNEQIFTDRNYHFIWILTY